MCLAPSAKLPVPSTLNALLNPLSRAQNHDFAKARKAVHAGGIPWSNASCATDVPGCKQLSIKRAFDSRSKLRRPSRPTSFTRSFSSSLAIIWCPPLFWCTPHASHHSTPKGAAKRALTVKATTGHFLHISASIRSSRASQLKFRSLGSCSPIASGGEANNFSVL